MTHKNTFFPGEEWLYLKIYCGYNTADCLIDKILFPIMEMEVKKQNINKWFFIKYGDPDHHLRIRAHFTPAGNYLLLLHTINKELAPYFKSGIIWKTELDTYRREIQRYATNYPLVESWFFEESRMIAKIVNRIHESRDEDIRWKSALMIMDGIFNRLGYNSAERIDITSVLAESYSKEFNMNKNLRQQLAQNYRKKRTMICELFANENNDTMTVALSQDIKDFLNSVNPIQQEVIKNRDHLSSHLHMLCNRLFTSQQRLHELVIFDLLCCHYKSAEARRKANSL